MKTLHAISPTCLIVAMALASPAVAGEVESAMVQSDPSATQPTSFQKLFSWSPLRFSVAIESRTTWLQNDAAKRMMGKDVSKEAGLSFSYDAMEVLDKTTLSLDLGWMDSKTTPSLEFSGEAQQMRRTLLFLGVSLRRQLWPWLAPYVRVAGGGGQDKLTMGWGTGYLRDTRRFGEADVGGGLYLRSPGLRVAKSWSLGVIGRVEGGYCLGSGSSFTLKSTMPSSGDNVIPIAPVAAGKIARNVPYLRVMVGFGF